MAAGSLWVVSRVGLWKVSRLLCPGAEKEASYERTIGSRPRQTRVLLDDITMGITKMEARL